jgi:hypothetical protein
MQKRVYRYLSSISFSQRNSLPRLLFLTCRPSHFRHSTTKNLKVYALRRCRHSTKITDTGLPGLVYIRRECFHWRSSRGKTICAEFVFLRLWSKREQVQGRKGKEIVSLTRETAADLRLLEKGDVVVCTPTQVCYRFAFRLALTDDNYFLQWGILSRRWRTYRRQNPACHGEIGPTYEVVISRTRYVSAQTEIKTRIVACGVSLANARDLGEWMGRRMPSSISPQGQLLTVSIEDTILRHDSN